MKPAEIRTIPWSALKLPPGCTVPKELGAGAFGLVREYVFEHRVVAVKELKGSGGGGGGHPSTATTQSFCEDEDPTALDTAARLSLLQEATILSSLDHDHIVHIFGVAEDTQTGRLGLVMKRMSHSLGGSSSMLKTLNVSTRFFYILQIAQGLAYLHGRPHPVVHGDIKPANVLVAHGGLEVALTDFGFAGIKQKHHALEQQIYLQSSSAMTSRGGGAGGDRGSNSSGTSGGAGGLSSYGGPKGAGTDAFRAPELFEEDDDGLPIRSPNRASDVYSFAITAYCILCGVSYPYPLVDTKTGVPIILRKRVPKGLRPDLDKLPAEVVVIGNSNNNSKENNRITDNNHTNSAILSIPSLLSVCWDHDPIKRESMVNIVSYLLHYTSASILSPTATSTFTSSVGENLFTPPPPPTMQEVEGESGTLNLKKTSSPTTTAVPLHPLSTAIETILTRMRENPTNPQLQEQACIALMNMHRSATNSRKKICELGGIQLILSALHLHSNQENLHRQACAAISSMIIPPAGLDRDDDDDGDRCNEILVRNSGIAILFTAAKTFPANTALQGDVRKILFAVLKTHPELKGEMHYFLLGGGGGGVSSGNSAEMNAGSKNEKPTENKNAGVSSGSSLALTVADAGMKLVPSAISGAGGGGGGGGGATKSMFQKKQIDGPQLPTYNKEHDDLLGKSSAPPPLAAVFTGNTPALTSQQHQKPQKVVHEAGGSDGNPSSALILNVRGEGRGVRSVGLPHTPPHVPLQAVGTVVPTTPAPPPPPALPPPAIPTTVPTIVPASTTSSSSSFSSLFSSSPTSLSTTTTSSSSSSSARMVSPKSQDVSKTLRDMTIKIVLVGDCGAGRSSLLKRLSEGVFPKYIESTIGVDSKAVEVLIDGKQVKLQIWDTAGQEKFRSITFSYFRGAHAIMLFIDSTNKRALENVGYWSSSITEYTTPGVPCLLVSSKSDEAKIQVTEKEARAKAVEYGMHYMAVDAKTGKNVKEVFEELAIVAIGRLQYMSVPTEEKKYKPSVSVSSKNLATPTSMSSLTDWMWSSLTIGNTKAKETSAATTTATTERASVDKAMSNQVPSYDVLLKILILGDSGSGKTKLVFRFADNIYTGLEDLTIGIGFQKVEMLVGGKKVLLQIWDTAGVERFRNITASYLAGADAIMLLADATDSGALRSLSHWRSLITEKAEVGVPCMLLSSKSDEGASRVKITEKESRAKALEYGYQYMAVDAKTGRNAKEALEALVVSALGRLASKPATKGDKI